MLNNLAESENNLYSFIFAANLCHVFLYKKQDRKEKEGGFNRGNECGYAVFDVKVASHFEIRVFGER